MEDSRNKAAVSVPFLYSSNKIMANVFQTIQAPRLSNLQHLHIQKAGLNLPLLLSVS